MDGWGRDSNSVAARAVRVLLATSCAFGMVATLLSFPSAAARAAVNASLGFIDSTAGTGAMGLACAALDQMSELEDQLRDAWTQQDWPLAIQLLEQILALDASRSEMRDNLYAAHVNYGYELYSEGRLQEARSQFLAALSIKPTGEEAQAGIALIQAAESSGTVVPTATNTPITPGAPTATLSVTPGPTPTGTLTVQPTQYVVQTGDTLYSLARRFDTTVQAIMQANGLRSYIIWIGQVLFIPAGGALPSGPVLHIVVPGDTLYALARHYGTTVQAIMWANGLWSYIIYVGQPLRIPATSPSSGGAHLVQWGETLYSIARLYGTTVHALKAANGLTSDLILAGTTLKIP
jgi:LysM repeat protein